ncbi:hypothetical protein G6F57_001123 [Rhizopus arrhizus]|uniref:Uncharacterized protein n=1 Tax=Rhizopus oryzae TaxID=64495 RepID=A0A9P6XFH5_RHIOR|nr:hypothetical protein G6F23_005092 [Rhizopus arrhizus]KAG1428809.1 hypothetical protein G6F58_000398 [Rhizopus delemar]KAG0767825.1 hypothetical protein G6F24_002467 [Rhizopus arrhizus]KAG0780194.1 hypothetical protein G6F22_010218 [Rhizopus arrhizus]KAG0785002.1 hypothetical protein G6F21_009542 [Rhizopus arrhizus]
MSIEISTNYSSQIQSTITHLEEQLLSIKNAQNELAGILQKTSSLLSENDLTEIKRNMDKVSVYHTKLLSIKATMSMLSGRSKQLTARAEKLKQIKKDYLSQIEDIKRVEKQKDQTIIATSQIASNNTDSAAITATKVVRKKKKKARQVTLDDGDDDKWTLKKSSFLKK